MKDHWVISDGAFCVVAVGVVLVRGCPSAHGEGFLHRWVSVQTVRSVLSFVFSVSIPGPLFRKQWRIPYRGGHYGSKGLWVVVLKKKRFYKSRLWTCSNWVAACPCIFGVLGLILFNFICIALFTEDRHKDAFQRTLTEGQNACLNLQIAREKEKKNSLSGRNLRRNPAMVPISCWPARCKVKVEWVYNRCNKKSMTAIQMGWTGYSLDDTLADKVGSLKEGKYSEQF